MGTGWTIAVSCGETGPRGVRLLPGSTGSIAGNTSVIISVYRCSQQGPFCMCTLLWCVMMRCVVQQARQVMSS